MAKSKTIYVCQSCGAQSPKWMGRCPECQAWNSYVEEISQASAPSTNTARGLGRGESKYVRVTDGLDQSQSIARHATGLQEFDRVLGGGLVQGSFVLIGGDPGIGKSTLMLQMANNLASQTGQVLYISGEESVGQTQLRARRLGARSDNLLIASETNLETILELATKSRPTLLVIDSIQTVFLPQLQSAPGTVSQVRDCAAKLMYLAKTEGITVLLVGHVTKDGSIAGPKVLEHMVDTVLSFEGDSNHYFRILRAIKNRFGAANEMGVFEMSQTGLREVLNPSELFLSERAENAPGSAVFCTIEGTRPYLVEVQALASRTNMSMPRRTTIGLDPNRVHLILAIMDKHLGLDLYAHDVFVNIAGGVKVQEPGIDLAIAAALLSSLKGEPISKGSCFFGELGLTGEVRGVSLPEIRFKEATKLGFDRFCIPKSNQRHLKEVAGDQNKWISSIQELRAFLGAPRQTQKVKNANANQHHPDRHQ
ncbi:MAG: DNA repair protein RadA [Oligoflexia bacterium]|nr:DNA repair protein RadA [Oligoflexia bacterium]